MVSVKRGKKEIKGLSGREYPFIKVEGNAPSKKNLRHRFSRVAKEFSETLGKIELHIITDDREFSELEAAWMKLAEISEGTIFQTFEWNYNWWKYFGGGSRLQIITIYSGNDLVAIFPLFVDEVKVGSWRFYSCLRAIGSTVSQLTGEDLRGLICYSDYLDAIVHPDYKIVACRKLISYFKSSPMPYQEIILNEVPPGGIIDEVMLPLMDQNNVEYTVLEDSVCSSIQYDGDWNSYLSDLSKSSRYRIRKYLKLADNEEKKIFEVVSVDNSDELENQYELLVGMHQQRWNTLGYPGVFAEKRYYLFLKEVTKRFMDKGWAGFRTAYSVDESLKAVAIDLFYTYRSRLYLVQRAFDMNSDNADSGPGNVLLYKGLKDALEDNITIFDFLRGRDAYKSRTADCHHTNKKIEIHNPNRYHALNALLSKRIIEIRRKLYTKMMKLRMLLVNVIRKIDR